MQSIQSAQSHLKAHPVVALVALALVALLSAPLALGLAALAAVVLLAPTLIRRHAPELAAAHAVEHVLPLCHGGRTTIDNVVPACRSCNSRKGRKTLERWREADWVAGFYVRWAAALKEAKEKAG